MLLQLGQVDDDLLVVGKEPVVVLEELAVIARGLHVVGEQLLVAIRVARDKRANRGVFGVSSHGGKQRVALKVFSLGVAKQRIKVVPGPQAVDAEIVGARQA